VKDFGKNELPGMTRVFFTDGDTSITGYQPEITKLGALAPSYRSPVKKIFGDHLPKAEHLVRRLPEQIKSTYAAPPLGFIRGFPRDGCGFDYNLYTNGRLFKSIVFALSSSE
jgi:hypothetical protein